MDLLQLDINQCDDKYNAPNAFKGTHKCDKKTSYVSIKIFISLSYFFLFFFRLLIVSRQYARTRLFPLFFLFQCVPILGRGFDSGGYKCECKQGYEYPFEDLITYYDGQLVEAEFSNIVNDKETR